MLSDLTLEQQVLNISVNLARTANFVRDHNKTHKKLINRFLDQLDEEIAYLSKQELSGKFISIFLRFKADFKKLNKKNISDTDAWAHQALTWVDPLQDSSKLV